MTAPEYRAAIAALGLTQGQAAKALGLRAIKTSWNYANGRTPIPDPIAKLLEHMQRVKLRQLREKARRRKKAIVPKQENVT